MGISDTFSDALETASDLSFESVFNMIFHTDTFPGPFTIMSIYICFYLRLSTQKPGMKWYRSFLLGVAMVTLPRFIMGRIIERQIKETDNHNFLIYFGVVWAFFNIFPFDIVFKFCNRPVSRLVLVIMEAISESLILVTTHFNVAGVFTYENGGADTARIIIYMCVITISPLFAQKVDAILSGERKRDFCFPVAHYKRVIVTNIIMTLITKESLLWSEALIDHYNLIPVLAMFNVIFRVIDYIVYEGYPFYYVDAIFPKFGDNYKQVFA